MALESPEKLSFPALIQDYLDRIAGDTLTAQNLPVAEQLLCDVQTAGKMHKLEEMLVRHGEFGLQSPYHEIIHSGNIVLEEPKRDGRSITLMNGFNEAALRCVGSST